jgi:hypothetical protein
LTQAVQVAHIGWEDSHLPLDLLGGVPYSARLRRIAKAKIEELDGAIERARAMQSLLRRALRCDCLTLDECGRRLRSVSEAR